MSEQAIPQELPDVGLTTKEKAIALFKFLKELNELRRNVTLSVDRHEWFFPLDKLPDDPEFIEVYYRDRVEDEDSNLSSTLLVIRKPELSDCPAPQKLFEKWLLPDWDDFHQEAGTYSSLPKENADTESENDDEEYFDDNDNRVAAFNRWNTSRTRWAETQRLHEITRDLFNKLYHLYFQLQTETETLEMIVANGMLLDRRNPSIKHPVLTHRVTLNYDAKENVISIEDTSAATELYTIIFQNMTDINLDAINVLNEDLQRNDYHPLDRNETPNYLKVLSRQLSSDSEFVEGRIADLGTQKSRLSVSTVPCYIVRKRLDGTIKAIERIIENILETGEIPAPIIDLIDGGVSELPPDLGEEPIEERLAAVGGESIDILLAKEANKEQLEIAKRISSFNAVLVQGPPGTGKTHTIANLMGHFLAQGQSVLVTSYTSKALSVLKDKVPEGLQNLCVSVIGDSKIDMERSIDGITNYMSRTTSFEVKREMEQLARDRERIIQKLADVRRKIFAQINRECSSIVYNGEDISPSAAAQYVNENAEMLSYIPGKVRLDTPLPLTFEQLATLYRSNEGITSDDELELSYNPPEIEELLTPEQFSNILDSYKLALQYLNVIEEKNGWTITNMLDHHQLIIECPFGMFTVPYPEREAVVALERFAKSFGKFEKWMEQAAVDGKKGGAFRMKWMTLIEHIQKVSEFSESIVMEQFGRTIQFRSDVDKESIKKPLIKMSDAFNGRNEIPKLILKLHKEYVAVLDAVSVNEGKIKSSEDCKAVLHYIEMEELRRQCGIYWDELLASEDIPAFMLLDANEPESVAQNWIPDIEKYLDWYKDSYKPLMKLVEACGFPSEMVFHFSSLDSELVHTEKILSSICNTILPLCSACIAILDYIVDSDKLSALKATLTSDLRGSSKYCSALYTAILDEKPVAYAEAYAALSQICEKYSMHRERTKLLGILRPVAPKWAEAIEHREGIHGQFSVPDTIEDAWKWKQYSGIIEEIIGAPFRELQEDSMTFSKQYRIATAKYAEKCGWYHLLSQTETNIDMKQALQGWKQTERRIGKGTGKNAPAMKAKARELMTKCQQAVPGWIMPINRALETLDPKSNRFDVIIIDEASQADISALAILYMGRKLIIVGDDKQVSPMGVGVDVDQMNALEQMYIKGKIPNSHLYNAKTSLYDLAATTFQPLMLREHFRCVPEIIGFSNMLSYDYKIKPLRDASSSVLLPAVVNYRVEGSSRDGARKTNKTEARAIVSLMKACIKQSEYKGKTFGVISMLGDEQAKVIQLLIEKDIAPKEIEKRRILCGNSAHFQGDERDVVFLSLVDAGTGEGPLRIRDSANDDIRKRYNVAASRARDQLWVVHSLDYANDLKAGDIRKRLIEYARDPQAEVVKQEEIESKAESPFEVAVASALTRRGYHIVQQWKVGAYRLDIVAVCGQKKVAIECDGDRWHSGEAKLREDMERQTILERIGWRFIRIRGSEYYRYPDDTITRVVNELNSFGILPEETTVKEELSDEASGSELLSRVKSEAAIIMQRLYLRNDNTEDKKHSTVKPTAPSKRGRPKKSSSQQMNMFDS